MKNYLLMILFIQFCFTGLFCYAQINIFEPCTNSTPTNPNLILGGNTYFTSGINDPSGEGYLRLTNASNYQTGSVYLNQSFPSNLGVVVEFEYWSWGPSTLKADGTSVFLFDGSYGPGTFTMGAWGAGLGYAETSAPYSILPGLTGGYIAVGLDEYGNWRTKLNAYDLTAPGNQSPNIAIRGRTVDHTPYLSGILMSSLPFSLNYSINTAVRPNTNQYYRKFQVAILYNASISSYQVAVSVQTSENGTMQQIISPYTMSNPPPSALKVGLASATGAYNSNHEIRNLRITTPGDVRVEKTGSTSVNNGEPANYTVTLYNDSPIELNSVTFKDILPTGFIPNVGTPVFNNGGNVGNTLVSGGYTGNIYDALLNIKQNSSCSFTFSGKFNVIEDIIVTNTAIIKTPMGFTDTDVSNDTARVETNVWANYIADFYANNVQSVILPDTTFCAKNVDFLAEIEGLNYSSLKWFINGKEEEDAQNQLEWSKSFETGEYEIKMEVLFENNQTTTITSILKMKILWVKMRNIKH